MHVLVKVVLRIASGRGRLDSRRAFLACNLFRTVALCVRLPAHKLASLGLGKPSLLHSTALPVLPTCTAQPKWHHLGYSLAPSKHWACRVQPSLLHGSHRNRGYRVASAR